MDRTRHTLRTVVQIVAGLAAGVPLIVDASGVPETTAGVGVALAVSAAVTRIMHLPAVQPALRWLGLDVKAVGGGRE